MKRKRILKGVAVIAALALTSGLAITSLSSAPRSVKRISTQRQGSLFGLWLMYEPVVMPRYEYR
jgi:hypothetical protein